MRELIIELPALTVAIPAISVALPVFSVLLLWAIFLWIFVPDKPAESKSKLNRKSKATDDAIEYQTESEHEGATAYQRGQNGRSGSLFGTSSFSETVGKRHSDHPLADETQTDTDHEHIHPGNDSATSGGSKSRLLISRQPESEPARGKFQPDNRSARANTLSKHTAGIITTEATPAGNESTKEKLDVEIFVDPARLSETDASTQTTNKIAGPTDYQNNSASAPTDTLANSQTSQTSLQNNRARTTNNTDAALTNANDTQSSIASDSAFLSQARVGTKPESEASKNADDDQSSKLENNRQADAAKQDAQGKQSSIQHDHPPASESTLLSNSQTIGVKHTPPSDTVPVNPRSASDLRDPTTGKTITGNTTASTTDRELQGAAVTIKDDQSTATASSSDLSKAQSQPSPELNITASSDSGEAHTAVSQNNIEKESKHTDSKSKSGVTSNTTGSAGITDTAGSLLAGHTANRHSNGTAHNNTANNLQAKAVDTGAPATSEQLTASNLNNGANNDEQRSHLSTGQKAADDKQASTGLNSTANSDSSQTRAADSQHNNEKYSKQPDIQIETRVTGNTAGSAGTTDTKGSMLARHTNTQDSNDSTNDNSANSLQVKAKDSSTSAPFQQLTASSRNNEASKNGHQRNSSGSLKAADGEHASTSPSSADNNSDSGQTNTTESRNNDNKHSTQSALQNKSNVTSHTTASASITGNTGTLLTGQTNNTGSNVTAGENTANDLRENAHDEGGSSPLEQLTASSLNNEASNNGHQSNSSGGQKAAGSEHATTRLSSADNNSDSGQTNTTESRNNDNKHSTQSALQNKSNVTSHTTASASISGNTGTLLTGQTNNTDSNATANENTANDLRENAHDEGGSTPLEQFTASSLNNEASNNGYQSNSSGGQKAAGSEHASTSLSSADNNSDSGQTDTTESRNNDNKPSIQSDAQNKSEVTSHTTASAGNTGTLLTGQTNNTGSNVTAGENTANDLQANAHEDGGSSSLEQLTASTRNNAANSNGHKNNLTDDQLTTDDQQEEPLTADQNKRTSLFKPQSTEVARDKQQSDRPRYQTAAKSRRIASSLEAQLQFKPPVATTTPSTTGAESNDSENTTLLADKDRIIKELQQKLNALQIKQEEGNRSGAYQKPENADATRTNNSQANNSQGPGSTESGLKANTHSTNNKDDRTRVSIAATQPTSNALANDSNKASSAISRLLGQKQDSVPVNKPATDAHNNDLSAAKISSKTSSIDGVDSDQIDVTELRDLKRKYQEATDKLSLGEIKVQKLQSTVNRLQASGLTEVEVPSHVVNNRELLLNKVRVLSPGA